MQELPRDRSSNVSPATAAFAAAGARLPPTVAAGGMHSFFSDFQPFFHDGIDCYG